MGVETNGKLYFKSTEDDTWKELASGFTNLGISAIETEEKINSFLSDFSSGFISLDLDYESKRINKKRLIKLLMAEKISRNEAYEITKNVWKQKKSYDIIDINLAKIGVYF